MNHLGQELHNKNNSVVLLTEPHARSGHITGTPNGTTLVYARNGSETQAPRAGILASKDVGIMAMDNWCNRDCAVALVRIGGRQTVLVSLYLDITKSVQPDWLDKLMNMILGKGMPVIIGTDSNAHSTLYGPDNNARGEAFEDFVVQYGLEIANYGTAPTFETRRGDRLIQTHIDVTLSRDLATPVENWRVNREYNASDHNTIHFEVKSTKPEPELVRPWSKADWALFKRILSHADYGIPKDMSMKKLDRLLERTYGILQRALDEACPRVSITPKVGKDHWSTDKHVKGKKEVSNLYRTAKRSGLAEDWAKYKEADRKFKTMCKNDRNRAWRKYKESIQSEKEMANLAKLAQRNERRDINVLTKPDGSSTDPGGETIDLLVETHFPAATNIQHVTYNNRRNLSVREIMDKYTTWIDVDKIRKALADFEKKKSPGPDEIKPLVFEHLPNEFTEVLNIIYKSSIHLGYTPKAWKRTKVIFIAKPGKERYDKPKSFRPISLSNYLLKGLERLVGWKMDLALVANPLHHKQHGFMSGKSTESAISNTTNYIEKFIMKKQHCVGVFLDISAAFDSIKPGHVRQALLKHGGDPEMVQWYYNYITHRDIDIDMHGERKTFSTGLGFPQGGVCSAKFWLIAFDYAIQIINRYMIEGNGYADDCSALYGGRRLDHALKRLQKMLDDLTKWGKSCGLRFNPEKSVAVIFSRRRKIPPFHLKIDGDIIEFKTEVKYLGVTLDSKLHWTPHINEKLTKTKKYLTKIASMTMKNWGPKPKLMRWAYLGIVRPMLCYGAMVWGHRAPYLANKLRRINRMALNTFANYPKSTPTTALEVILDVMPLHLYCTQEAVLARIRLDEVLEFGWDGRAHTKHHAKSHMRHLEDKLEEYGIEPGEGDRCSSIIWDEGYRVNWSSFDGLAKHRQPTEYNVFTDGSRMNERTGAGLAVYKGRKEVHTQWHWLPNYATVFQAEIAAVEEAAKYMANEREPGPKFVKILIDSQAAIAALGNPRVTSRAVGKTIQALNQLASKVEVLTLVWVPAHKGHVGNEKADELAKRGSEENSPERFKHVGRPQASIKAAVREKIYSEWQLEWVGMKQANHSKSLYGGPNPGKARFVYKLARLELGRFVRVVTGHNNLNFFQNKIGLCPTRSCRFCDNGDETLTHFLVACPRLRGLRGDIFLDRTPSSDMTWSVRDLLQFSYSPGLNEAYEGCQARDISQAESLYGEDGSLELLWLEGMDSDNESD